jgi:hypothetical protein
LLQNTYRTFQDALFSPNPLGRRLVLAGLLASGLIVITLFIGVAGPVLALAVAAAIIGGGLILNDTHWGYVALCGVVFCLALCQPALFHRLQADFSRPGIGCALFCLALQTGHRAAERVCLSRPSGCWWRSLP